MKKIKLLTSCLLLVLGLSACTANKDAATKKSDTSAVTASQGETVPGETEQGKLTQEGTAQEESAQNAAPSNASENSAAEEALKMTQADIYLEEITDFYYTAANAENNSGYLRYRFYVKDGSYFFSFDKRDANGNYAATEGESGSGAGNVSLGTEERCISTPRSTRTASYFTLPPRPSRPPSRHTAQNSRRGKLSRKTESTEAFAASQRMGRRPLSCLCTQTQFSLCLSQ